MQNRHSQSSPTKIAVSGSKVTPRLTKLISAPPKLPLYVTVGNFIAKHNMAFLVVNHFNELFKKCFLTV